MYHFAKRLLLSCTLKQTTRYEINIVSTFIFIAAAVRIFFLFFFFSGGFTKRFFFRVCFVDVVVVVVFVFFVLCGASLKKHCGLSDIYCNASRTIYNSNEKKAQQQQQQINDHPKHAC